MDGGLGRWDGRREVRGALGNGVEVVIKRLAREADHLGVGYI